MNIQPIQLSDIELLYELQPPDWDDIRPHFKYYINTPYCEPLKITSEDKIIGIGSALKHRDTVWLAHIIVHPEYRNKGIGKIITDALVASVDKKKYETIYLIATELGYPVYLKSGFEVETEYAHFEFERRVEPAISKYVIPFEVKHKPEIIQLDHFITGEYREIRLNEHFQNSVVYLSKGKVSGAYFPKLGDGLIIANLEQAAIELMKFRLKEKDKAIFPIENKTAFEFYDRLNFKKSRNSKRMRLGKNRIWHPENLYNRVSGQIG